MVTDRHGTVCWLSALTKLGTDHIMGQKRGKVPILQPRGFGKAHTEHVFPLTLEVGKLFLGDEEGEEASKVRMVCEQRQRET